MKRVEKLREIFSTYSELHAFVHGIYSGIVEWKGIKEATWENEDCEKEPHYVKGGYVLGTIIRWLFLIILTMRIYGG